MWSESHTTLNWTNANCAYVLLNILLLFQLMSYKHRKSGPLKHFYWSWLPVVWDKATWKTKLFILNTNYGCHWTTVFLHWSLPSNAKATSHDEILYRVCVCHKVKLSSVWRNVVMQAVVGSSLEEGFIVFLSLGWCVSGLLSLVWVQRCSPWGSKPINIQLTVPRGDAFAKALCFYPMAEAHVPS